MLSLSDARVVGLEVVEVGVSWRDFSRGRDKKQMPQDLGSWRRLQLGAGSVGGLLPSATNLDRL